MITIHPPEELDGQYFANTRIMIAMVDWSGRGAGRLAVLMPCYKVLLEDLFLNVVMVKPLGGTKPEPFPPWSREAVEHLLHFVLPSYGLIPAGIYY